MSGHLLGSVVATDAHFHEIMLALLLSICVVAFGLGYRHHRSLGIVVRGVLGMELVIVAASVDHSYLPLLAESSLNIVGSVVLLLAHRDNVRAARRPTLPAN
ncbi:MAG: MerC domain-containing protein [Pseudomonadota bacterium]